MATTYNVYRDGEKVASGIEEKTYQDTGLSANTEYEYQVSAENEHGESDLSEVVVVTTDPITVDSQESLKRAIDEADSGEVIELADGFTMNQHLDISKDIEIDGNNNVVTADIESGESCFKIKGGANVAVKNLNVDLTGEGNRAFLLHSNAGNFAITDSSIDGSDIGSDGHKGISSSPDSKGDIVIDNVEISGMRTGVYRNGNQVTEINNTTFENNYRGMTIHGDIVPVLTNNTFTNNDGDISADYDSEIKDEIAQEAENPDNNNMFDDDTPKYNWSTEVNVESVTLTPKTSSSESGTAGNRDLTANVEPEDADNKDVSFSIDDAEGLTVSNSGKIEWTEDTPAGDYVTTVTTDDGGFTDTHTLTLTEPEEPEPEPDPEEPEE